MATNETGEANSYAQDLDLTHPNANMFGAFPCPKCKSRYRWPNQKNEVICDDCGLVQTLSKKE